MDSSVNSIGFSAFWRDSKIRSWIWAISALALGLRLLNLGGKSLWLDEAFNLAVAKSGCKALWTQTFETHHPPLYYCIQQFWVRFGESETWLRLLPALLGAALIPLLFAFAKKLAGKNAAITAAGLAAVSPLMIWYSQEARSYSFIALLGLAATSASLYLFLKPGLARAGLFALLMTAALYTHYEAIFLVPLQFILLIFLAARKKCPISSFYPWLAGLAVAGAAFYPWLKTPAARMFLGVVRTGSYPGQLLALKLGTRPEVIMMIITVAALVIGVILAGSIYILVKKGLIIKDPGRGNWRIDAALVLIVGLILGLASVLPIGYSIKKQLVLFWPYGLVLIGRLWPWNAYHKRKVAAACGILLTFSLINIFVVPRDDWKNTVRYLGAESRHGDVVFLLPGYCTYPFEYYNCGKIPSQRIDADSDVREMKAALPKEARVWLITNQEGFIDPKQKIRLALARGGEPLQSKAFYRIRIDLYDWRE